jgi:predicted ATP-grasp superfamily ATP-dependent carboligase
MPSHVPANCLPEPMNLVIAGLSGRALAQSARRAGHTVTVLDLYSDQDTLACATAAHRIAGGVAGFDRAALLDCASRLAKPCAGMVTGSGFEDTPELLDALAKRMPPGCEHFGNPSAVIGRLKDPDQLRSLLASLGLPHPRIAFRAPPPHEGWLVKRAGGHGGLHVRRYQPGMRIAAGEYFQEVVSGRVVSALFLANGRRAWVLGYNELLRQGSAGLPFHYAGAVSCARIGMAARRELGARLDELVAATGMVGLNGVDFVVGKDRYFVLEINPRPTATLDLYDPDSDVPLIDLHIAACQGRLPRRAARRGRVRGHAVVRALRDLTIGEGTQFAPWASDLPLPGEHFTNGSPVCTVRAAGVSPSAVRALLAQRRTTQARALIGGLQ